MMTLERVLREVNKDTFHITDYEKLEDPAKRRIRMDPTKGFDNSPYNEDEKDQLFNETVQQIITRTYQAVAEANVVAIFFKQPELILDYPMQLEDFTENTWRVYWQIANDIIVLEKKSVLDDMTVGLYLEKHPKLKAKYDE